jgi:hypothetical protein
VSARWVVLLLTLPLLAACGEELRVRLMKQKPERGGLTSDGN